MLVGLERPGDGLLNTILYLTGEIFLWVPDTSNIILACRCKSSVAAKRLGDGFQLLLSMALRLG